jgi:hypothetical protein
MTRNKGWLRDGDWEEPEISFRHDDYKNGNRRTVVVVDGVPQHTRDYRYPRITPAFASPLVNDVNLALCGGFSVWEKETNKDLEDEMIIKQVFDGHKPLGAVYLCVDGEHGLPPQATALAQARDKVAALVEEAERRGLATRVKRRNIPGYYGETICVDAILSHRGTLGNLFDLDALAEDWQSYLVGNPDEAARTAEQLDALRDMRLEEFMDVDFEAVPTSVLGLVLGYPVWSSAACVLDELGPRKPLPSRRKQALAMTTSNPVRSSSLPRRQCGAWMPRSKARCVLDAGHDPTKVHHSSVR